MKYTSRPAYQMEKTCLASTTSKLAIRISAFFYGYYVVFLNLHQSKPLHTSSSLTVPFAANLGQFVYVTFLAHIILLALSYLYGCCMYAQPTQPLSQLCIAGSEVHLFIYPIVQLFLGTQISRPGFKWSGGFLQKCLN